MTPGTPLQVAEPLPFQEAISDWQRRVGGRYGNVYASPSAAWFNDPAYIDQLRQVLSKANTNRGAGQLTDDPKAPDVRITAELPAAAAASIVVPRAALRK